jgi:hypothetical protein
VLLLWKLLDENEAFRSHVLHFCDVTAVTAPLLHLMWSARQAPSQVGLVHLCTFVLLLLSGERAFGVGLSEPATHAMPAGFPLFEGSHVDELVIVLHKLIVDGVPRLSALYSCFLTIVGNVAPYAKNVGLVASNKLLNLFELFSSPAFLFARPNNFVFVQQLLETFNTLVQYQYAENGVLVYSLVRRKELFERLQNVRVGPFRAEQAARRARAAPKPPAPAPGQWSATEEWCDEMVAELPLLTTQRLIEYLAPLLADFVRRNDNIVDDDAVVRFIRATTVVGMLPQPHPILMRKYVPNAHTASWFSVLMWSWVFLGKYSLHSDPLPPPSPPTLTPASATMPRTSRSSIHRHQRVDAPV